MQAARAGNFISAGGLGDLRVLCLSLLVNLLSLLRERLLAMVALHFHPADIPVKTSGRKATSPSAGKQSGTIFYEFEFLRDSPPCGSI